MCKKVIFFLIFVMLLSTFMTYAIFAGTAKVNSVEGSSLNEPDNPPENAVDNDPETRWGALKVTDSEDGGWLEIELDKEELIESVNIIFYKYSERIHTIGLDKYVDGQGWVEVELSKIKSDPSKQDDTFALKTATKSKSWRIRFISRVDVATDEEAEMLAVCEVKLNVATDNGGAGTTTSNQTSSSGNNTNKTDNTGKTTDTTRNPKTYDNSVLMLLAFIGLSAAGITFLSGRKSVER